MDEAPAIRTVNGLIGQALRRSASDIHLEPYAQGMRVRYRCDGFLYDSMSVLIEYASQVIARIKVLARLDISEKRIPQDGKFVVTGPQGDIDLRVATFPSLYGEKVVVRILDRSQRVLSLEELGCESQVLAIVQQLMQRSHGFFVVTGPTGSGKSTTLYALLSLLRSPHRNMVTLEDPIEYTIHGVTQGQVHPDIGFDFARGIRALLRQDPDVIMVGEMRDMETAQIAIQAALTGHLVLSTLHTTDAPGAVIRLLDMGIKAFLINAAVTGVLAQRLVRRLCEFCKEETELTTEEHQYLAHYALTATSSYHPRGCKNCAGTGYKGRMGIFEILRITPTLRAVINDHVSYDELHEAARREGLRPLYTDGFSKVTQGLTSLGELMRVVTEQN